MMTYRTQTIGRNLRNGCAPVNERDTAFMHLNSAAFHRQMMIRRIARGYAFGDLDDVPSRLEAAQRSLRFARRYSTPVLP